MQGSLDPFQWRPHQASKRYAYRLPALLLVPNVAATRRAFAGRWFHLGNGLHPKWDRVCLRQGRHRQSALPSDSADRLAIGFRYLYVLSSMAQTARAVDRKSTRLNSSHVEIS